MSDLAPVHIDTAFGFVFVTLDDAAPPLAEALDEMPPWLARASRGHRVRAPYADLFELIDTSGFDEIHREITRGLAIVETSYTGGPSSGWACVRHGSS